MLFPPEIKDRLAHGNSCCNPGYCSVPHTSAHCSQSAEPGIQGPLESTGPATCNAGIAAWIRAAAGILRMQGAAGWDQGEPPSLPGAPQVG